MLRLHCLPFRSQEYMFLVLPPQYLRHQCHIWRLSSETFSSSLVSQRAETAQLTASIRPNCTGWLAGRLSHRFPYSVTRSYPNPEITWGNQEIRRTSMHLDNFLSSRTPRMPHSEPPKALDLSSPIIFMHSVCNIHICPVLSLMPFLNDFHGKYKANSTKARQMRQMIKYASKLL